MPFATDDIKLRDKVKIAFFTSIAGWGGSETYLRNLISGMREFGHEVILIGVEGSRLMQELAAGGVRCVAWTGGVAPGLESKTAPHATVAPGVTRTPRAVIKAMVPDQLLLLMGARREVLRLETLFGNLAPDVMHVNVHGYELAGLACRRGGIPCVAMYLTSPIREQGWARRWLVRRSIRWYDYVAAQSHACLADWVHTACYTPLRSGAIWNSADDRYFKLPVPRQRVDDGKLNLVYVGRYHPMKGCRYLIEAMALLRDLPVMLTMVGWGEEEDTLRQLSVSCGVADRVRFVGPQNDAVPFLETADVFVMASISHESGPAALAEAMAAGLPCVTSDFGPLAEMNVHGGTGLVVPQHSADALADAIRKLRGDSRLRRILGDAARCRARECFSRSVMLKSTQVVYDLAVQCGRNRKGMR